MSSEDDNHCPYSVGRTLGGDTVFRISDQGGYAMTLTMNALATRQMIRLLEAALDPMDDQEEQTE